MAYLIIPIQLMTLFPNSRFSCRMFYIAGLHPQSCRDFSRQVSPRVSHTLSFNLSHMMAAAMLADEYWRLYRSDCRNTMIYAKATLRTLPIVTSVAHESGNFVALPLLYASR